MQNPLATGFAVMVTLFTSAANRRDKLGAGATTARTLGAIRSNFSELAANYCFF